MTEESPSYLPQIQPEALRLADALKRILNVGQGDPLGQAADELLRLHAENQTLQAGYDAARLEIESLKARVQELGRIARENRSRAIVDLEAQIDKLDFAIFAIECYEKYLDTIKAALAADKYDSKDWREGCTLERIQWLHDYYQGGLEEIERLTADVLSLQAMLMKANNQAEHFERHWYLRGDEVESLQARDADRHVDYCTALRAVAGLQARVQELEAMLDAVGAGGVEPLRRAKCLHQITEPKGIQHDEDLLEQLYWDFDDVRHKNGDERMAFKGKMRFYAQSVAPHHTENLKCKSTQKRLATLLGFEPVRKPLTDERLEQCIPDDDTPMGLGKAFVKFARAIEAAHGITALPPRAPVFTDYAAGWGSSWSECGACGDGCKTYGTCRFAEESPRAQIIYRFTKPDDTEGGAL